MGKQLQPSGAPKGSSQQARIRSLDAAYSSSSCVDFSRKAIFWWLPLLYLLICDAFYLRTYDSAQVKITLVQMGGVCLLGLWLARLLEEGFLAVTEDDVVVLAPFLAYLLYGIASFIHAPYTWSSTDFFLRRLFYMTVPLILIQEFNAAAIQRVIRFLILATWIAAGYGCLQWFDIRFFPAGPGNGPDPFIWRGAFGQRVFSTYGNPNFLADYLVLMFPILVMQWFKTRQFRLVVLTAMDLFVLVGTQTKGAWIAFALTLSVLLATYFWFFDRERLKAYKFHVAGVLSGIVAVALVAVWIKLQESFTSVNFRLFTWEATWEMIMTQPWFGTGIGSYWVIYPAFRRPPIFHIEGKHNTETDHSEDEYLEVLFDEGIAGFGIFLWLIVTSCWMGYKALQQLTFGLGQGERAPPRAYELLGVIVGFQGMLLHNFFDVSMRFVSSGVYFGLLSGLIVNLSRGMSLSELHAGREAAPKLEGEPSLWETLSIFFLWPARLLAWGCVLVLGWRVLTDFADLQGPLNRLTFGGEILQWWIAWILLASCVAGLGFAFLRISWLARNALVPLAIAGLMLPPIPPGDRNSRGGGPVSLAWGFFRADVYHNIAIFFSKQQRWEEALRHYLKVGELNPAFIMSFYFKGNVFNDRFSMQKVYNPNWGDQGNVPRDDYERAMEAYDQVRSRAPNYVQMHHQVGALHMKLGEWLMNQGRHEEGQKAWDKALEYFELYRKIDPVFPANYFRIGQIHMLRKDYDKAIAVYKALIEAKECRVVPELANNAKLRRTILHYTQFMEADGAWVHRHEYSENYFNLGNAYFMAGRVPEAEKAFSRALELDPKNAAAQRNLEVLRARVQFLKKNPGAPLLPAPAGPQPPGGIQFIDPRQQR